MSGQELWGFRVGDDCRVPFTDMDTGEDVWLLATVVRISGTSPITRDQPQISVQVTGDDDGSESLNGTHSWVTDPQSIRRPEEVQP